MATLASTLGPSVPLGPNGQPLVDIDNPNTSSPLLALSQYLNGIQNVTSGSSSGDNGNTAAVNPNIQLTLGSGGATGIQQELAVAQKYDPNASIVDYDNSNEGDNPMERIQMNQSLLPQIPAGFTALGGVSDNSDAGGVQGGQHVLNGAQVYTDPNWGLITPEADINQNYDTHGGGFFKNIGDWAPLVVGGVIGAAGAGFLPGFGGMSDAAAQGLVSGTTGSGLSGGSFTGLGSIKPAATIQAGMNAGQNVLNGNPGSALSSMLPGIASFAGLPSYAGNALQMALQQALAKGGQSG